jgi:hypothetical protein
MIVLYINHPSPLYSLLFLSKKQSNKPKDNNKEMEARVISCTTFGDDKVVKIAVLNHQAVAKYETGENETTVVVSDDTCSEKDVKEIKKCCEKLGYVYEGKLNEEYTQTNTGPGLV